MILFVGENAPNGGPPLTGGYSGTRLERLTGGKPGIDYQVANLCEKDWDDELARRSFWRILRDTNCSRVILLGRRVAKASTLRIDRQPFMEWFGITWIKDGVHGEVRAAIVPHPSGLNRWWNDPEQAEEAERFLRGALWLEGAPCAA